MEKILILGLAGYRITRFLIEDKLIERPRTKLLDWFVVRHQAMNGKNRRFWFNELYTLITCAFCLSIWISIAIWNLYGRAEWLTASAGVLAVAGVIAIVYDLRPDEIVEEIKKSRKGDIN